MIRRVDRRKRPTPRWDPPARMGDTRSTVIRLAKSLAIAASLRKKEGTNAA